MLRFDHASALILSSTGKIACFDLFLACGFSISRVGEQDLRCFSELRRRATLGKPESKVGPQRSTLRFVGTHSAAGKSLSWFLYSPDMRYCCKTADPAEAALLLRILPSYEAHAAAHAVTLLPRFLGLYNITVGSRRTWVLVQGNVFAAGLPIFERYDLKGSWAGRSASARELAKGVRAVLKDRDFIARGRALACTDPAAHATFDAALRRDAAFLRAHGLIDYSLLIGLVPREAGAAAARSAAGDRTAARHGVMVLELEDAAARLAVVGLVDILMEYGWCVPTLAAVRYWRVLCPSAGKEAGARWCGQGTGQTRHCDTQLAA